MAIEKYKGKEQILLEMAKTKQRMDKARLNHNHFAFVDLKKHYDKLIKELRAWKSLHTMI